MRIALNGFGRIGRTIVRILLQHQKQYQSLQLVAINIGPMNPEIAALLFEYDTVGGSYPGTVSLHNSILSVDGISIELIQNSEIQDIDWKKRSIDWVIECTGVHTTRNGAELHRKSGASGVLLCTPAADADKTIIMGVNHTTWNMHKERIVSLGSCTTNAAVPVLHAIHTLSPIQHGALTTIHAYTGTQALLDTDMHDPRRSRAAGLNIIPSSTGALEGITTVMPELHQKLTTLSVRIPVAKVSFLELTLDCNKKITPKQIHQTFENKIKGEYKNIVQISTKPLVSSDFSGNLHSVIIDAQLTTHTGPLVRICGWYDNEVGYSARVCDALKCIAKNS